MNLIIGLNLFVGVLWSRVLMVEVLNSEKMGDFAKKVYIFCVMGFWGLGYWGDGRRMLVPWW